MNSVSTSNDDEDNLGEASDANSSSASSSKRPDGGSSGDAINQTRKRAREDEEESSSLLLQEMMQIDWDAIADRSKTASMRLARCKTVLDHDSTIGWAINISRPDRTIVPADISSGSDDDEKLPDTNDDIPLMDLPSQPLNSSLLHIVHEAASEALLEQQKHDGPKQQEYESLFEAFDQSALVSLGICVEEMITASLIPLATVHAKRCRRSDELMGGEESSRAAARQWLQPPEECILAAQRSDERTCLFPSLRPAHRTVVAAASPASVSQQSAGKGVEATAKEEEQAVAEWAQFQELNVDFVKNNNDIFGVPSVPDNPET